MKGAMQSCHSAEEIAALKKVETKLLGLIRQPGESSESSENAMDFRIGGAYEVAGQTKVFHATYVMPMPAEGGEQSSLGEDAELSLKMRDPNYSVAAVFRCLNQECSDLVAKFDVLATKTNAQGESCTSPLYQIGYLLDNQDEAGRLNADNPLVSVIDTSENGMLNMDDLVNKLVDLRSNPETN